MNKETDIDVLNEYTERRIRAYLASLAPRDGEPLSGGAARGRSLIEQIALSAHGDEHPPLRLPAAECADVLEFMAAVEPLKPSNWWVSPEDAPCHITGMNLVLDTLVESLRPAQEARPAEDAGEWDDLRRTLHALAPDASDIPTLQEVRTALEGAAGSLDTHVASLEMACHALRHTETTGDPESVADVLDEVIIPHLREQVSNALEELFERIPAAQVQS